MRSTTDTRPFRDLAQCQVILPDRTADPFDPVDSFCQLLIAERAELEAELGCPVRFASERSGVSDAGTLLVGPGERNPALRAALLETGRPAADGPIVWADDARRLVAVDGRDIGEVGAAFQLLRTAIRTGAPETRPSIPESPGAIVEALRIEVAETYPSFAQRGIDWDEALGRHERAIVDSGASIGSLQRLFADLQDAHTWVRATSTNARLPYRAWIDPERALLAHVPTWSAAWAHGVRAGDALEEVDRLDWWERTAATPRTRALVAGFRWLSGTAGATRSMRVRKPDGSVVEWDELVTAIPWPEPISWRVRDSGTGYLRIRGWTFTREWMDLLDAAFDDLAGCPRLLVDLRGNVGGQLIAAQHFRDRFLSEETELGSVQFSIGGGRLGERSPIVGAPTAGVPGWRNPVRFLIDRQTYSASEDAILGLGGLPHVQVVGEPSGGGSGRPRTIWLREDAYATISTALTFDRQGRCVEANGLPVDLELPIDRTFRDPLRHPASGILAMADADWH